MAFLIPEYVDGRWARVTDWAGEVYVTPEEYLGDLLSDLGSTPEPPEIIQAVGVRLSAPGYLDATDWYLAETETDARRIVVEDFSACPDCGASLDDTDDRCPECREIIPD